MISSQSLLVQIISSDVQTDNNADTYKRIVRVDLRIPSYVSEGMYLSVLGIRNYFFRMRIRNPELRIRIRIQVVNKLRIQIGPGNFCGH
jgi:hypothetical protein